MTSAAGSKRGPQFSRPANRQTQTGMQNVPNWRASDLVRLPPFGADLELELMGRKSRAVGCECKTGAMAETIRKPSRELSDSKQLLLGYLDYYRSVIGRKVAGLTEQELRSSRLPSGWTPLQLVKHLTYMERRWFR
jgi:Protein of unknown function (DUF664)